MMAGVRQIDFLKVSGAGNDFILIDNITRSLDIDWVVFARTVCSRPFGIGADGLLVIEPSPRVDFLMRYFNADGSSGGMCGNGGRCVARYAHERGFAKNRLKFEALDYVYEAFIDSDGVILRMKDAVVSDRRLKFSNKEGNVVEGLVVDSGSPHIVTRCNDLDLVDVAAWGELIRHDPVVGPEGTNVNFFAAQAPDGIGLRTYERGVEGETMACGTGAVAAAVVSALELELRSPVKVLVRSGETLIVDFVRSGRLFTDVTLKGSAHILFSGSVFFDESTGRLAEIAVKNFEHSR